MTEIILAIIGSGALSAAISGVFSLISSKQKRKKGLDKALGFLLLYQIKTLGSEYIARNYISLEEKKEFEELYSVYKGLGMNGFAESVKSAVDKVPIKED